MKIFFTTFFITVLVLWITGFIYKKKYGKEWLNKASQDHYSNYILFFIIIMIIFSFSYLIYFSLNGAISGDTINNVYSSGLLFAIGNVFLGALCKIIYRIIKKFERTIREKQIKKDLKAEYEQENITPNEEKAAAMMVLVLLTLVLFKTQYYLEALICSSMIISYFSWVIPQLKTIRENIVSLFDISFDSLCAMEVTAIVAINVLFVIDFQNASASSISMFIVGLVLGVVIPLLALLFISSFRKIKIDKAFYFR